MGMGEQALSTEIARWRVRGPDADDVAQQVRLAMWRATLRYDPGRPGTGAAWVRQVVRREVAHTVRRLRRW